MTLQRQYSSIIWFNQAVANRIYTESERKWVKTDAVITSEMEPACGQ